MVLLESLNLPLHTSIIDFKLEGTDGKIYSPENFKDAKIFVIVFMCNHCPYVQAVWKRLVKLQEEFKENGVRFVGINPNFHPDYPEETPEKMREYFKKFEMNFPYLMDKTQEVAKAYMAQCTPDIYVYNEQRLLQYHGRIDDNWKEENKVSRQELKEAITDLLEKKSLPKVQHPSMGCSIKWLAKD